MDWHVKYRPTSLSDLIGQEGVVRSLTRLLQDVPAPHVYLFSGPSGVGKTTVARIVAAAVNAEVIEIDAATHTGVDSMRELSEMLQYKPWSASTPNRCVIVDECHALSKPAWQSLLKLTEEPPAYVYLCFCTTEVDKVPRTIITRSHHYRLSLVAPRLIERLVRRICRLERCSLPEEVVEWVARKCEGSVRQALVYASMCRSAKTVDEAKAIVAQAGDSGAEAIEFFRELASGRATWKRCLLLLRKLEQQDGFSYESLRIGLVNYIGAALVSTEDAERAKQLLAVVEAFGTPLPKSTERASFLFALGNCIMS